MKTIVSLAQSAALFANTYKYLKKTNAPNVDIEVLKMQWAQEIVSNLKVGLEISGEISENRSLIFFGNHISYLDIPILMSKVKGLSFVAKEEISAWPVIGPAAQKVETVFVKRENGSSRKQARTSIQQALEKGQRVAIFPSGTTCLYENKPWRRGAFEIAHENDLFLQPFRLTYAPLRTVAYIDDDFLPTHLCRLFTQKSIQAKLEFHAPIKVTDPVADCEYWQAWSKGLIQGQTQSLNELTL